MMRIRVAIMLASMCLPSNSTSVLSSIEHRGYVVGDVTSFWTDLTIPVCWENPDAYKDKIGIVRQAIEDTWQQHSALKFTGWRKCQGTSRGIRILIDDYAHPHVKTFGRFLDGVRSGVVLSFNFLGDFKCHRTVSDCIRIISVHEFGHAIGFHHEQNSSETHRGSPCFRKHYQGKIPNEVIITEWDLHSVMNYCNPLWSGDGKLSDLDKQGVQSVYGTPGTLTTWSGIWISETYNRVVGRRFRYVLHLRQHGANVEGTYVSTEGNEVSGELEGTVTGNVFEGQWKRTDRAAPASAQGGFIFVLGNGEFSGHYSQGAWSGAKQ